MIDKKKHKRESGQGLVEFGLVLPVLLLTLMGIADFGRLFAVYSELLNAAREGARYGVVSPMDVDGITLAVTNKISMVELEDVSIFVTFDGGPGTSEKNFDQVMIGDRVIVTLNSDVDMMTPFIRTIAQQLHMETAAARTISTVVGGTGEGGASPPTSTPDGTTTPSPTPTPFSLDTPTPTLTSTPGPTLTPTPPAGIVPIQITTPLWDGDMVVTGVAQAGEVVNLRDIQNPALDLSTVVSGEGTFQFDLPMPLVAGHVISVQGYGSIDYALVEGAVVPTPTPTPTATSVPTPTPSTQYIDIDPTCGPGGATTITVSGHLWPTKMKDLFFLWDGVKVLQIAASSDFEETITVTASAGSHTVRVETELQNFKYYDSKTFVSPCASTPTPTPSQPNLVVESISLGSSGVISTYQPLTFTVAVRNIGAAAVNSLFWVDLYMDPAVQPPAPGDLMGQASEAWVAVSSLSQDEVIYLTLSYLQGVAVLGDHNAYALADTWDQVLESDESDNVGGPVPVLVSQQGVPPTATPAPTPGGDSGAISGSTWLFINGDVVPQGRINVYCYDGDVLVAETLSDQTGNYLLEGIPAGACTVSGQTVISGALYQDYVLNVQVNAGQTTPNVTLVLH